MLTPEREAEAQAAIIGARAAQGRHRLPGMLFMADLLEEHAAEIDRLRAELAKHEHNEAARENTDAHNRRLIAERDEARAEVERERALADELAEALRLVWDEWPRLSSRRHATQVGGALRLHDESRSTLPTKEEERV